eukprot:UN07347
MSLVVKFKQYHFSSFNFSSSKNLQSRPDHFQVNLDQGPPHPRLNPHQNRLYLFLHLHLFYHHFLHSYCLVILLVILN